jgi:hypothetical protein
VEGPEGLAHPDAHVLPGGPAQGDQGPDPRHLLLQGPIQAPLVHLGEGARWTLSPPVRARCSQSEKKGVTGAVRRATVTSASWRVRKAARASAGSVFPQNRARDRRTNQLERSSFTNSATCR